MSKRIKFQSLRSASSKLPKKEILDSETLPDWKAEVKVEDKQVDQVLNKRSSAKQSIKKRNISKNVSIELADNKSSEKLIVKDESESEFFSKQKSVEVFDKLPSVKQEGVQVGDKLPSVKQEDAQVANKLLSVKQEENQIFDQLPVVKEKNKKKNSSKNVKVEHADSNSNEKLNVKDDPDNKWFPQHWEQQLYNIRQMRKARTAPVDTMGCDECPDKNADEPTIRFQVLVSLMLSSQTKDQVTHMAVQRLKVAGCTPENIIAIPDAELEKLIYPVGFYKRKVQYLKKVSNILIEKYSGDIPNNIKELCDLPGVGPKMAHLAMQVAWNEVTGIGVDTHVHRISNRLKWLPKTSKTPEETRVLLESWLPKELWREINHLLVGFGQTICQPVRPKCSECMNKTTCEYAKENYKF